MTDPVEEFERQPHTVARGKSAENAAVAWLERHGYRVIARNHETAAGEIDLIAEEDDTLCFVEVKAVLDPRYGSAIARVRPEQQTRIARAASIYLAESDWRGDCRFDILGLEPGADDDWRYDLIRNAFETGDSW